jgi:uncharacterized phage protein (TIGR01671 family)
MEIKFRGLLLKPPFGETNVSWVYGDLLRLHDYTASINVRLGNRNIVHHVVSPNTVGQYINLKDDNGQEIYVGDIGYLQTNWGERLKCVVEFFTAGFIFSYLSRDDKKKCIFAQDVSLNKMEFEIIGNIHENPELTL